MKEAALGGSPMSSRIAETARDLSIGVVVSLNKAAASSPRALLFISAFRETASEIERSFAVWCGSG
jgi:hypothetical protein